MYGEHTNLVDLLAGSKEANIIHVHSSGLPHFYEVLANLRTASRAANQEIVPDYYLFDLLEIAAHLVVEETEPISNPENEYTAGRSQPVEALFTKLEAFSCVSPVDINSLENTLGNMHAATRLKSVVTYRVSLGL